MRQLANQRAMLVGALRHGFSAPATALGALGAARTFEHAYARAPPPSPLAPSWSLPTGHIVPSTCMQVRAALHGVLQRDALPRRLLLTRHAVPLGALPLSSRHAGARGGPPSPSESFSKLLLKTASDSFRPLRTPLRVHPDSLLTPSDPSDPVWPVPQAGAKPTLVGVFAGWNTTKLPSLVTPGADLSAPRPLWDFADGEGCWGGPARSARVELRCAEQTSLAAVEEDGKCTCVLPPSPLGIPLGPQPCIHSTSPPQPTLSTALRSTRPCQAPLSASDCL